jgi:glucose/arabinose dehydrogenase
LLFMTIIRLVPSSRLLLLVLTMFTLAAGSAVAARQPAVGVALPPGFAIDVFSGEVPGARSMTLSPAGTLFVGTRNKGVVYAIPGAGTSARAAKPRLISRGLASPNGVAVRDGALYVAEISRILRFDDIEARLDRPPTPAVVTDRYPTDGHHGSKFIAFGPDGWLYVPVGAPCNVCLPPGPLHETITRMKADGSAIEVFARGVRNSVGFDWQPGTHDLWFTDNGRDWMGDDRPPDELNHAPKPDLHFGFPYCHGRALADPQFGRDKSCTEFTPPAAELGPHVAALGMRFYTGTMFPPDYRGRIFIAEHGSWNRSTPIGYRITTVRLEGDRVVSYEPFATGWLADNGHIAGRPVDVLVMPDGALLVSDDYAGAIYRITYRAPRASATSLRR